MMDRFANDVDQKTFLNLLLGQQYCQQNANVGPRITDIWEFICEGALKHSQDPKILPRRDRAPRSEIPGSATVFN